MPAEATNPVDSGSAPSNPSLSLDDAVSLVEWEPEDEANPEGTAEAQTDSETDDAPDPELEAEAEPADDDDPQDQEDEAAEAAKPEPPDDVTVTVNGEKVALSDLKAGYMRQADYSRKTQDVANNRRRLEEMTGRVTQTVTAVADFLASQIPDAPDAILAMTEPARFVQMKAMHEAAVSQVNAFLAHAGEAKAVSDGLTQAQRAEIINSENAKLAESFPQTATPEGRKAFFEKAAVAARDLGYSTEEISAATDHRLFKLAHYAAIGFAAEKAKTKAVAKVEGKPPVAPTKRLRTAGDQMAKNREAMKRLTRSGSIEDAMQIDWE